MTGVPERGRPGWPVGLSARLLALTALFVMLAELMILAPDGNVLVFGQQIIDMTIKDPTKP